MRIRLPLGRSLFFLCAFLFSLLALFPLRLALGWLALDDRGFAAREAEGVSGWAASPKRRSAQLRSATCPPNCGLYRCSWGALVWIWSGRTRQTGSKAPQL
jgi:hypothetical protein